MFVRFYSCVPKTCKDIVPHCWCGRVYLYILVCICTHVYIYVYVYIIYTHIYLHIHIHRGIPMVHLWDFICVCQLHLWTREDVVPHDWDGCICVCIYIYIHIHTCMHIYIYIYIYIYILAYIYIHIHRGLCIVRLWDFILACQQHVRTSFLMVDVGVYACVYVYTYMYIYLYIYIYMCT